MTYEDINNGVTEFEILAEVYIRKNHVKIRRTKSGRYWEIHKGRNEVKASGNCFPIYGMLS